MEKYVGFWNNSSNEYPQFPMPVPTNAPAALRERIASVIAGLQEKADVEAYRGFSTCRICGENRSCLGHQEYKYLQYTEDFRENPVYWIWPEGIHHYIIEHGVMPPLEFINEVLCISDKTLTALGYAHDTSEPSTSIRAQGSAPLH